MKISISLLSMNVLVGIFFLPILMKYMSGVKRLYVAAQHICIICYLLCLLVETLSSGSTFSFYKVFGEQNFTSKIFTSRMFAFGYLLRFISQIFYINYYYISILNAYDIYVMTCQPFDYAMCAKKTKLAKRLTFGFFVSIFANSNSLFDICYQLYSFQNKSRQLINIFSAEKQFILGSNLFNLLNVVLIKATSAIGNLRIYVLIKRSLKESMQMSSKQNQEKLHQNVCQFILVPFFLNLLFLGHDIPTHQHTLLPMVERCSKTKRDIVLKGVSTSIDIFTLGSLTNYICYIIFFPKIRQLIACRNIKCQQRSIKANGPMDGTTDQTYQCTLG